MPAFFPFNSVIFLLRTNTEDYGMAKITISEALKIVPVKKTALYGDIKRGVLSADLDSRGRKVVDTAELERVYGHAQGSEHKRKTQRNTTDKHERYWKGERNRANRDGHQRKRQRGLCTQGSS